MNRGRVTADYADPICREELGNSARIEIRLHAAQIAEPCRSFVSAKQHSAWNLLAKIDKGTIQGTERVQHAGETDEIFKVRIGEKQKAVE